MTNGATLEAAEGAGWEAALALHASDTFGRQPVTEADIDAELLLVPLGDHRRGDGEAARKALRWHSPFLIGTGRFLRRPGWRCGCPSSTERPPKPSDPDRTAGRRTLATGPRRSSSGDMFDRLHVHHCPYCPLRFVYANEVKDHVIRDHPEHAESFLMVEPHELPVT